MVRLRTVTPLFLRQFTAAWGAWIQSFGYLKRHNLQAFHAVGPGAIALLTSLGWWLTSKLDSTAQAALQRGLNALGLTSQDAPSLDTHPLTESQATTVDPSFWNSLLSWAVDQLEWVLHWGVIALVFWLKIKVTKYLLLTLVAPFMSLLAAKIQQKVTGQATPLSLASVLRDIARGIRTALSLFLMEMGLTLTLAILGLLLTIFTPPIAVLFSPILLATSWTVGSYFYGAAVFDAVFEQQGMDWRTSIRNGWQQKGHLIGIGMVFSLLLAIPVAGPFLAALLGPMPATAAAAKLTFHPSLPAENQT